MTKHLLKFFAVSVEMSIFATDLYINIGTENEKIYHAVDVAGDPRPDSWGGVALPEPSGAEAGQP
jgi:hypothetical protein